MDMLDMRTDEELFIDDCIQSGVQTNVFLDNGTKISGIITTQDGTSITIKGEKGNGMIYKRVISTVFPDHDFRDPDRGQGQ